MKKKSRNSWYKRATLILGALAVVLEAVKLLAPNTVNNINNNYWNTPQPVATASWHSVGTWTIQASTTANTTATTFAFDWLAFVFSCLLFSVPFLAVLRYRSKRLSPLNSPNLKIQKKRVV